MDMDQDLLRSASHEISTGASVRHPFSLLGEKGDLLSRSANGYPDRARRQPSVTGGRLRTKASAPSPAARAEPARTPILAAAASGLPGNAWSASSSDSGSPIPQRHAAPRKASGRASSGRTASFTRSASQTAPTMPIGLAMARPTATPANTRSAGG